MSLSAVVSFWQRVQADRALRERVDPAVSAKGDEAQELEALVEIARENGFEATVGEFAAAENVLRFWERVSGDDELQRKLRSADRAASKDVATAAITKIANEEGYPVTGEQLELVTTALESFGMGNELGDEELEQVAGGATAYSTSYRLAFQGGLSPTIRLGSGIGAITF